ncbi:MAG: chloride channel protein [Litoreibacter sp.]
MGDQERSLLREQVDGAVKACRRSIDAVRNEGLSQIQFWIIALGIGVAAGFIALFFRKVVNWIQGGLYGAADVRSLTAVASELPWFWVVIIPTVGGLLTGIVLHLFTNDARVRSVADVIEGAALNDGRVEKRAGIGSAIASMITLSTGGSTGREGPVVHMAGVVSSWVCGFIKADGITGRDLLGCAVAAGVSASFNAPIAGALFALEVVLRHFAIHAFAPIVIASAAGTVISRWQFGDVTEFTLPVANALRFYVELPAFLILGLICGGVAVLLMRSIFWADEIGTMVQSKLHMPRWLRPSVAGLLLGILAVGFPHIIGVGYSTTSAALTGDLLLWEMIIFAILKVAAVSITMAGRMGGGVFAPALMIGALTGLAFGVIATGFAPNMSGSETLYALAGMGAVAAAVLGAPISTTLIVFELTGDWQTGLAVMVAVSMSTAFSSRFVEGSFFLTQLARRGVHLARGSQAYLLKMFRVANVMRLPDDPQAASEEAIWEMIEEGFYIDPNATLEDAMPMFERNNPTFIPVVTLGIEGQSPTIMGALFQVDALKEYNRALAATAAEEHS